MMLAKIMICILDEVPTAKERDKGHWIDIDLDTSICSVCKKPFCPKYGEMVYYGTVSGYIQEVRFDTDSTLHQLLRKAGKLYRSEE